VSKPLTDVRAETERVRQLQDQQAPHYDRQIRFFERVLFGGGREWATSQVRGDVLEIAAGTGRNFEHYPPGTRLTAIELSREMLAIAKKRAKSAQIEIELREGDAQQLESPDESFDTVVITLALCTIPDDRKAAEEAYRVLRPGGRLVLLEHVRSVVTAVRVVERMLQPLALRFGGDNLVRDPLDYLSDIGFEIESVERSKWGIVERTVARKPDQAGPGPISTGADPG
jgi:ubiquinone/menaquinone biosynthesis C-methylase UbiE